VEAFLISAGAVALAEIGDKTQLLALTLTARFRRPVPIILGVLVATLANHLLAALVGFHGADFIDRIGGQQVLRWIVGVSFIAMAAWTLIPDKLDDDLAGQDKATRYGVFLTTLVSFFLVEMGDKTQIATVALAARFHDIFGVAAGTTIGMLIANVPVILLAGLAAQRLPLRLIRTIAALLFAALGVAALIGWP
jgi:putative Ca2+/H+ antiporter (TMEM165/GDT1 family)